MYVWLLRNAPDAPEIKDLPQELKDELLRYKPSETDLVCIWFDRQTKGCKHYEHRPDICRDFEIGSSECHTWRRYFGMEAVVFPEEALFG